MTTPSGPDRIREAIARDRGHYAPSRPVTLCGTPDGTEHTVREWDELAAHRQERRTRPTYRHRTAERLAYAAQCPSCLGLRFGPVHLSKRLLIGKH